MCMFIGFYSAKTYNWCPTWSVWGTHGWSIFIVKQSIFFPFRCLWGILCSDIQLCLTLCDPMDCSLPSSSVNGIFPGKNTGVGCYFLLQGLFPTQGLNPVPWVSCFDRQIAWAFLVKNPPALWETWVRSLGWEDPMEKEWLPAPVFWPGESHGLYSAWGRKELDMTGWLSLSLHFSTMGSHYLWKHDI